VLGFMTLLRILAAFVLDLRIRNKGRGLTGC
jgi:hypothetical protein